MMGVPARLFPHPSASPTPSPVAGAKGREARYSSLLTRRDNKAPQVLQQGVRERVATVRAAVTAPMTAEQVTACFKGAKRADVGAILESLASVGVLLVDTAGRYLP